MYFGAGGTGLPNCCCSGTHTHTHARMHACTHARTHTHTHTHTHTIVNIYNYEHTHNDYLPCCTISVGALYSAVSYFLISKHGRKLIFDETHHNMLAVIQYLRVAVTYAQIYWILGKCLVYAVEQLTGLTTRGIDSVTQLCILSYSKFKHFSCNCLLFLFSACPSDLCIHDTYYSYI